MEAISNYPCLHEWDTSNKKQIENAKSIYQLARRSNRKILSIDKNEAIQNFRTAAQLGGFRIGETELSESQFAMQIFDGTGDSRLIWDSRDKKEVKEAAKNFDDLIAKGGRAYAIDMDGNKKRRIYSFDPMKEELYFDDKKTVSQKLQDFVKSFKTIKMTPKNYPG